MTKNTKSIRRSFTHAQRQARFEAEMGGAYPVSVSPEFSALASELIGVDTAEQIQARVAHEGTVNGYRENSPELYGRTGGEVDFGCGYAVHAGGADANAETDELGAVVIGSTTHKGGSEAVEGEVVELGNL